MIRETNTGRRGDDKKQQVKRQGGRSHENIRIVKDTVTGGLYLKSTTTTKDGFNHKWISAMPQRPSKTRPPGSAVFVDIAGIGGGTGFEVSSEFPEGWVATGPLDETR
jgi:hypothetical protein